jgi:FkbM family methyltransferase
MRFLTPHLRNPESELRATLDTVLSHYRQTHPEIRYLQVGAFDGVTGDPIYPLIERYGLRGCLVEPQRDAFARLQANYSRFPSGNFVFVNAAIGERDGTAPLYRIQPEFEGPDWLPQIASLDRNFLVGLSDLVPNLESFLEVETVPCLTFDTLFRTYGLGKIDLLQIDAEGRDAEILELFDVTRRRPAIVHFEHKHLSERTYERCVDCLIPVGYKISIAKDDTLAYVGRI